MDSQGDSSASESRADGDEGGDASLEDVREMMLIDDECCIFGAVTGGGGGTAGVEGPAVWATGSEEKVGPTASTLFLIIGMVLVGMLDGEGFEGLGWLLAGLEGQKSKLLSKRDDLDRSARIHNVNYITK